MISNNQDRRLDLFSPLDPLFLPSTPTKHLSPLHPRSRNLLFPPQHPRLPLLPNLHHPPPLLSRHPLRIRPPLPQRPQPNRSLQRPLLRPARLHFGQHHLQPVLPEHLGLRERKEEGDNQTGGLGCHHWHSGHHHFGHRRSDRERA
ncbi:hypothetical protein ABW19_dt0202651 [Dactylella cylindrospora]|nr:hypothetical protein ABW19_dt0202651 [Dactylella cylindrospora]